MNTPQIPPQFATTIRQLYGASGEAWLSRLPSLLEACAARWSLTLLPPFKLSYNYVTPATRADGTEVVIKIGHPQSEIRHELATLQAYAGEGIVKLLEADEEQFVFVLERLRPGEALATLPDDEQATAIAAGIMQKLWRPAPSTHSFPSVADWASGLVGLRKMFDGGTGPLDKHLVEQAETHFTELLSSTKNPMLLHGDLHHDNILSAHRDPWLALDPKGVVGDPAYEVGTFLLNPLDLLARPDPGRLLARRVAQFSEILGFDRQRLQAWGVAQAVLSAWWSIEDHEDGWKRTMECARLLAAMK